MKRQQISKKDKQGYIILVSIVAFLMIIGIIAYFLLKPSYHCEDNNLTAHTLIIIDTTDPLTEGQQKRVLELIKDIKNEIVTYEKLSIFILETALNGLSEPLFSACQPPKGSEANPFYQNRRIYEKKYQESYQKLFNQTLPRISQGGTGTRSPIMEALVDVEQRADFSQKIVKRRIVLISDLLQNTNIFSFYEIKSALIFDNVPVPNLRGVQVELHIIHRPQDGHLQGNSFMQFWMQYFQKSEAQITKITRRF